jgi:phenylacetate-coenzyme A ligase PaaK-like adenylate-forming protein
VSKIEYCHPDVELLDRDAILAIQRRKLALLGKRLAESPEWVAHFARAGMKPTDLADHDALAAAPTLEKTDLRERYPFPLLGVGMGRVRRFIATSGTTGLPVMFGMTDHDLDRLLAGQMCRILKAAGVDPADRFYQGYGYGLWVGGLALDVGLKAFGATNFPLGPGRSELAVTYLKDHGYTACSMSPLWLMTLVNAARDMGVDPKTDWKLRVGLFGGQSVSAKFRDELEAALPAGFAAQNIYGTTEAGGPVVGISCPYSHDRDEMHLINEDTIITEVLDPKTMKPVGPGEVGELVVTTLDKEASPVVRWRTHDLVRLSDHPHDCPCGRKGLPLIGRIIGRNDDMLKVRGVIVFPTQIEDIIANVDGTVKEAWHIHIDREDKILEEISVEMERVRGCNLSNEELAAKVQHLIHSRLGIRVNVVCRDQGTLPRYEAKAVRVHIKK